MWWFVRDRFCKENDFDFVAVLRLLLATFLFEFDDDDDDDDDANWELPKSNNPKLPIPSLVEMFLLFLLMVMHMIYTGNHATQCTVMLSILL